MIRDLTGGLTAVTGTMNVTSVKLRCRKEWNNKRDAEAVTNFKS